MKVSWLLAAAFLVSPVPAARAAQVDCEAARCAVRAAIEARCPCSAAPNHGQHVSCVTRVVRELSDQIPNNCRGKVVRCAAASTCGKAGFVTCIRPKDRCDTATGTCARDASQTCVTDLDCTSRCKVTSSAERCLAIGGTVGASSSCCPGC
jgi:hypothetical protein